MPDAIRPDTSEMIAVHDVLRSSLASGPELVASALGDDGRRSVIANYYANLMGFLHVHHPGEEDLIFPLLMERAPRDRVIVDRAAQQHADVIGQILVVNESIRAWESGGDVEAPGLVRSLTTLD